MKQPKRMYSKKWIAGITVLLLILAGLWVSLSHNPVETKHPGSTFDGPPEVTAILQRACYDCHSNEPQLSWLDGVPPLSWKVKADVERAREVMNFSEWNTLGDADKEGNLWAILNMIKAGKMPLKAYASLHPKAKITAADVFTIEKYVHSLANDRIVADTSRKNAAHTEFEQWKQNQAAGQPVPESPNGIPYSDDFKSWKVISMSTLYDHSMRVIYGNDIAVKAIAEENFHPWPDGAQVVKAVWEQVENPYGELRPGKFVNVQVMVKDAQKFKDTEGWGFAKFSTRKLIPTGSSAMFASKSCIACHRQLAEETGFLFNVPLKVNPVQP